MKESWGSLVVHFFIYPESWVMCGVQHLTPWIKYFSKRPWLENPNRLINVNIWLKKYIYGPHSMESYSILDLDMAFPPSIFEFSSLWTLDHQTTPADDICHMHILPLKIM